MATVIIVALRGSARCVIPPGQPLSRPHGIQRDPHAVSTSVTHVPG